MLQQNFYILDLFKSGNHWRQRDFQALSTENLYLTHPLSQINEMELGGLNESDLLKFYIVRKSSIPATQDFRSTSLDFLI